VNEKRVAEICDSMLKEGIGIKWGNANGRTDQLTKYKAKTWQLLSESGLQSILTGAETYDDGILKVINKGATVEDTTGVASIASKYAIKIKFSFMIGLPIADRKESMNQEFSRMIDFINSLYKVNSHNHFLLFLYTPFPGTPLYDKSIALGYKGPTSLEEWGAFLEGLNHSCTPWTDRHLAEKVYQANFYFPFLSDSVREIISQYRNPLKSILLPIERLVAAIMRLRLKYKIFALPVEYHMIKLVFRHVNKQA